MEHNHSKKDKHRGHSHSHHHGSGKRLGITIVLNIIITVSQYIGGIATGSLALLSDATHNFSDVIALIISWIANKLAKTKYSKKRTFGYKRAEVIAAIINVVTIIVIAFNIFLEAIQRINQPTIITGPMVMLLAGLSIVINGLSVLIVKKDAQSSMNMRSAYLHLFSDMLTSFAVLFVGIVMYFFKVYWLDSLVSIAISVYLLFTSYKLLMETLRVIMQFTPDHIDLNHIKEATQMINYVDNIHHLHVWQLTDNDLQLTGHIDIEENITLKESTVVIDALKKLYKDEFGINHVTLQLEYMSSHDQSLVYDESNL